MTDEQPPEAPSEPTPHEVNRPKNLPDQVRRRADETGPAVVEGIRLDPRDQKLAFTIEQRILQVIRRETRDPYGGLPADDVLARLEDRFPGSNIAERMMARLEKEQDHRQEREGRRDELMKYEAETRRLELTEDVGLQSKVSARAERVVVLFVVAALLLVFTGHETVGGILLGTTLVSVVGALVTQRVRLGKS